MRLIGKILVNISTYIYEKGFIPITPHVMFPFLDDDNPTDRESAMQMDIELLSKCDEMWVFSEPTPGMEIEIAFAKSKGIQIYYFKPILQQWATQVAERAVEIHENS